LTDQEVERVEAAYREVFGGVTAGTEHVPDDGL
jgi:hypothetical protein